MRAKGISYDTGFLYKGRLSREHLEVNVLRRELAIIRDDLHCNAVRLIGGDPERLESAATCAGDLGLEVWFSPYPLELTADEMLTLFSECAERAEHLRRRGVEVVFVSGAELSIMNAGFLPGATMDERLQTLFRGERDERRQRVAEASARVNDFVGRSVGRIRQRFNGKVTYAAVPFERIDWTALDFVSVDLYRSAAVADQFRDGVRHLVAQGKPVAITEFGAATYRGAGDRGAQGLDIVEYEKDTVVPIRLKDEYVRDEAGQARYLCELLDVFDTEGVDSAFVFAFALDGYPHRPEGDPRDDLDLASYGIVKMLDGRYGTTYPDMPWEPKEAFSALAQKFGDR